jgi:hypothetical protein
MSPVHTDVYYYDLNAENQDMIVQYCAPRCSDQSEDFEMTALRMQGLMGSGGIHRSVHVPSVTS